MNNLKFMTPQEREAYRTGYERGRQEGLKKASLLIQLVASDSGTFQESIQRGKNFPRWQQGYHRIL